MTLKESEKYASENIMELFGSQIRLSKPIHDARVLYPDAPDILLASTTANCFLNTLSIVQSSFECFMTLLKNKKHTRLDDELMDYITVSCPHSNYYCDELQKTFESICDSYAINYCKVSRFARQQAARPCSNASTYMRCALFDAEHYREVCEKNLKAKQSA